MFFIIFSNFYQVALHLLSEREKDDLCQLVDTMVCFSITYRNSKPELPEKTQRYGATTNAVPLSLEPPLHDYVNFKVCFDSVVVYAL